MTVEISSTLLARLLTEARNSPEAEICGLLFGTPEWIDAAEACTNVAADPRLHFEIDPVALFAAHRAARQGEPRMIGHYHSHPSGVAEPSARDAEAAMGDGALWLIATVSETRLWRTAVPGVFEEVALLGIVDKLDLRLAG